ncbi:MAG: phosphoribosyltransferase, partial [Candidatus Pacebacteria bacterium CG10_big_fil_rev_8_21_14_0_10_56_10]
SSFENRSAAGRRLADQLSDYTHRDDVVVLALPRGGLPVAAEVTRQLGLQLDVMLVRKIGFPGHPEYGIGAISEHQVEVIDQARIAQLGTTTDQLQESISAERQELERRLEIYRQGRSLPNLTDKTVLLVDDGVATGVTMKAAVESARKLGAAEVVVAVPVCAADSAAELRARADRLVCLLEPANLRAVGQYYQQFDQLNDDQVVKFLSN